MDNEEIINPSAVEVEETDEDQISIFSNREKIAQTVVSASDWTTETIISQLTKGNIWLKPNFQRRDAWTIDRKSKFIESIVLGFPIPQIVLAEKNKAAGKGKYIVLDGKQRLQTLLQFIGEAKDSKQNKFSLTGLET